MRRARRIIELLVLAGAFAWAGLTVYKVERRMAEERAERELERSRRPMVQPRRDYVTVRGDDGVARVFTRQPGEADRAWAERVRSVVLARGVPDLGPYQCVELTGCAGGVSMNVCELCEPQEGAAACRARAEETAATFRDVFECD